MSGAKHTVRTCMNCAYRKGLGFRFAKCLKTGFDCEVQRQYPSSRCDREFSGWAARPSIVRRILSALSALPNGGER